MEKLEMTPNIGPKLPFICTHVCQLCVPSSFGQLGVYAYIHIHVLYDIQACGNIVSIYCQGTKCTVISAGSDIHCTSSYLGVTPIALTNAGATANEATQGAPITGPGLAGPSPPSTHMPPASAPSLKSEAAQAPEQVGC